MMKKESKITMNNCEHELKSIIHNQISIIKSKIHQKKSIPNDRDGFLLNVKINRMNLEDYPRYDFKLFLL